MRSGAFHLGVLRLPLGAVVAWILSGIVVVGAPPLRVNLQLKWGHQFQFAGYYVAVQKGFYRDAGLDVKILDAVDPTDVTEAVLRGTADFGIASSDLVRIRAQGSPVVALAAIFQHSPLVFLVRADSGIKTVHDLVGKKVMIEPHADELLAFLRDEGIGPSDFIRVRHPQTPLPLIDQQVDAMSAYVTDEPFLLSAAGIPYRLLSPPPQTFDFYSDVLFTSESFLRQQPGGVEAFVNATVRGWEWAIKNSDATINLILNNYGTRHSRKHLEYEARQTVPYVQTQQCPIGAMNMSKWQAIADNYARLSLIPRPFSLEGFLYEDRSCSRRRFWTATGLGMGIVAALGCLLSLSHGLYILWMRFRDSSFWNGVRNNKGWGLIFGSQRGGAMHSDPKSDREMLSTILVPIMIGLAYTEMVPPIRESLRIVGTRGPTLLLAGTFMLVVTRFFIGNQLHLVSPAMLQKSGLPWLFDLLTIITESIILILLAGTCTVAASRGSELGFLDLLSLIYIIDICWILGQRLICCWSARSSKDDIPWPWALLNFILLVIVGVIVHFSYDPYSITCVTILLFVNVLGFVGDVVLINYRGAINPFKDPQLLLPLWRGRTSD